MSDLTHAEIPWSHNVEDGTIESAAGHTVCCIVPHANVNTVARTGQTHSHADADFIVEASVVAHETGRTPKQLAEERAELLAALAEIIEYEGGADNALEDEYVMQRAHDTLSKIRGDRA